MPDHRIDVDVGRGVEPALAVDSTAITVDGPFVLALHGGDAAARVHCRLDGNLSRVARVDGSNHYVGPGEQRAVEVAVVEPEEPVSGTLELGTGYGAESIELSVTVEPSSEPEVEETLAEPRREEPRRTEVERLADSVGVQPATLGVTALGGAALVIAAATAAIAGGTAAYVGLFVVIAGVVVAVALVLS